MKYHRLFSDNLPATVEIPPGYLAQTKYVFSITFSDPDTIPAKAMSDSLTDILLREGRDLAMYPPPHGHLGLRELIAQNLKTKRGADTDPEDIVLTVGAGGGIRELLDALIDPGDIVLLEEFSYLGTLAMLLAHRAQVIHIQSDEQGMNTDALEEEVKALVSQGKRPKMIYTISVYQNPMGMTLSLDRRKHMLDISNRFGIPILENESYADFRIDGSPLPPSMLSMDTEGAVTYASAYTKLLGCGLRLGYLVVPEEVKGILLRDRMGRRPSHLTSMAVYEYLRHHMDKHIEAVRDSMKEKRDAMLTSLKENFPSTCTWSTPEGGMTIWVRLPESADTWSTLEKAVEADVKYNPGPQFRAQRDGNNYLRLTYSYNTPQEIRDGVAILAEVFDREGLFR